ncbi:DUF2946 family protein [Stenotrophomonas sp. SY1]|uniref:DUF2946 family protein n=1 Tax=Stenotrophomonas sp. SY1 TaxID=477235 RepID=UPI001E2C2481|nr:DUF2946 family protein [Stenotrophomonas sp. SY1]MCD9086125.1 DUF2946 family protein [Stenotrophomonas sp. SY1]
MRATRFQSVLLLLAFAAALLMAVAPVVSRWVQAGQMQHAGMTMAMHSDSGAAMDHGVHANAHAGHHGMDGTGHALHMAGGNAEAAEQKAPADPHAAHGEACDYCTMASRLLPWLAVLLVLAPLLYRLAPESPRNITLPSSLRWPAHPARGPPLFS